MEQYINFVHNITLLDNTSLTHSLILAFFSLWAKWDEKDYSKSFPFKKLRGFGNEESWMSKAVEWRYTKSETLSLAKWAWTAKETSSNLTNPCISGVWQPKIPSRIQQKSDPRGWGACFPKRELVGRSDRTCYRVQPCGNKSSPHEISKEENDQVYFIKLADRR